MPSPMLLFYLAVELVVGTWGLFILSRERHQPQTAMSGAS
jgi:hypothetical protein